MSALAPLVIRGRTLSVPVVQGGMGVGISRHRLAGSVAAAGGMGTLAAQGLGRLSSLPGAPLATPTWDDPHGLERVREETRLAVAHAAGRGIVAVNVMVAVTQYAQLVEAALAGGAQAIVSGAGLPLDLPGIVGDRDVALIPIVSSARALRILCRVWRRRHGRMPDAVVLEGPRAGGHLGFKREEIDRPEHQLERLIPEVVGEAQAWGGFPVIAAGGIWDGRDVRRMLALGAGAVQLGTRFLVTEECDVDGSYKARYLAATADDIVLVKTPVGMWGRVLRTPLIEALEAERFPGFKCHYKCLEVCDAHEVRYCIADHLVDAATGGPLGLYFIGGEGHRCDEILTVAELVDRLVT